MRHQLLGLALATFSGVALAPSAASAQLMVSHACVGSTPASNEAYIWVNANYGSTCSALYIGYYPTSSNFGLPNDSISSFKTGSGVRLRFFKDAVYTSSGGPLIEPANTLGAGMIAGWNDVVSSIKVDDNSRAQDCSDLRAGEFGVYSDANYANDCSVLMYNVGYVDAQHMGIQDSAISSIRGGVAPTGTFSCTHGSPGWYLTFFDGNNFSGPSFNVNPGPGSLLPNLTTQGWNDRIGSVSSAYICPPS